MSSTESPQGQILRLASQLNLKPAQITDGYHTFEELYTHRIELYVALCKIIKGNFSVPVWASTKHSDGSSYDNWFILGIYKDKGRQITYHLPSNYWSEVCEFAEILEQAPEFDGHSSADVIDRIKKL